MSSWVPLNSSIPDLFFDDLNGFRGIGKVFIECSSIEIFSNCFLMTRLG